MFFSGQRLCLAEINVGDRQICVPMHMEAANSLYPAVGITWAERENGWSWMELDAGNALAV